MLDANQNFQPGPSMLDFLNGLISNISGQKAHDENVQNEMNRAEQQISTVLAHIEQQ